MMDPEDDEVSVLGSPCRVLSEFIRTNVIWNLGEIWGRITCQASATAGTMIWAQRWNQPDAPTPTSSATRFDH